MTMEIFVQCVHCDRIYPAIRDETGNMWTSTTNGCPQCEATQVREITA